MKIFVHFPAMAAGGLNVVACFVYCVEIGRMQKLNMAMSDRPRKSFRCPWLPELQALSPEYRAVES